MNSSDPIQALSANTLYRRIHRIARDEGVRGVARRIVGRFYGRIYLLDRSLADPIAPSTVRIPIVIEMMREEDLLEYADYRRGHNAEAARQFLADGHCAFVARCQGKLVGSLWAAVKPVLVGEIMSMLLIEPGEVYLFDGFTLPEFRGQGIAPALSAFMLRHYASLGFRRAIRAAVPSNAAALRAHAKSGFRIFILRRAFRLGPWRYDLARRF